MDETQPPATAAKFGWIQGVLVSEGLDNEAPSLSIYRPRTGRVTCSYNAAFKLNINQ